MPVRHDLRTARNVKAIDLYDERIRTILTSWKSELRQSNAKKQAEFDAWLRDQSDAIRPVKE